MYVYEIKNNKVSFSQDITPEWKGFADENPRRRLPFGMGGIDVYEDNIAVCSVGGRGDGVFVSRDGGKSYDVIKSTDTDRFVIDVPYQKPEYNGGRVLRYSPQEQDLLP